MEAQSEFETLFHDSMDKINMTPGSIVNATVIEIRNEFFIGILFLLKIILLKPFTKIIFPFKSLTSWLHLFKLKKWELIKFIILNK